MPSVDYRMVVRIKRYPPAEMAVHAKNTIKQNSEHTIPRIFKVRERTTNDRQLSQTT